MPQKPGSYSSLMIRNWKLSTLIDFSEFSGYSDDVEILSQLNVVLAIFDNARLNFQILYNHMSLGVSHGL